MSSVQGSDITITTQDGTADAYVTRPDDGAVHPGVLFYTDLWGVRPSVKAMADRIAANGFTVLVPNVFYRTGPAPTLGAEWPDYVSTPDEIWSLALKVFPITRQLTHELALKDAVVWLDWLAADERTSDGPAGVTGYCHGGMMALITTIAYPDRIAAASLIHASGLITEEPDSPHIGLERIQAELFLLNSDGDNFATPQASEAFQKLLSEAGIRYTSDTVHGCEHGWTAKDTFVYDEEGDAHHWAGMLGLFDRVLTPAS